MEINLKLDMIASQLRYQQCVFNTKEAAEYLRISESYLRELVYKGDLRFKTKGRYYLFKKEWLDEWMEKR